jgi:hypothetical protein
MRVWKISGWDSTTKVMEATLPGHMEPPEVIRALERLVSRHLSDNEVIAASLRRNAKGYAPFLERIGYGFPIQIGSNPYYIAEPMEL